MSGFLDIYSGNLEKCPNCGNTMNGDFLYECKDVFSGGTTFKVPVCGKVYCEHCAEDSHDCPNCGSIGVIIGKIDPEAKYYIKGKVSGESSAIEPDPDKSFYSLERSDRPLRGIEIFLILVLLALLWFIVPAKKEETRKGVTEPAPASQEARKPIQD